MSVVMVYNMNVEIKHLVKKYNDKIVLDDFSLVLPQKGTVCLFGPSGCGKTTLLNCMAGLDSFDSGEIIGVQDKKISYLFQEDRLLPWISAKENIAAVLHLNAKKNSEEAEKWLALVGLEGEGNKLPAQLSGGMRQRVAIARALAYGGGLYLLDEPFHALDEERKSQIISLIQEHTPDSLKILVTHDPHEAELFADITYVLNGPPVKIVKLLQNVNTLDCAACDNVQMK